MDANWCVVLSYTDSGVKRTTIRARGLTVRQAISYAMEHGSFCVDLWPRQMTDGELRNMNLFRHPPTSVLPLNPICVSPEEVRLLKSRGFTFECQRLIRFMGGT